MSSIAIGKISHDPLMIRDAITTHPLCDPGPLIIGGDVRAVVA